MKYEEQISVNTSMQKPSKLQSLAKGKTLGSNSQILKGPAPQSSALQTEYGEAGAKTPRASGSLYTEPYAMLTMQDGAETTRTQKRH